MKLLKQRIVATLLATTTILSSVAPGMVPLHVYAAEVDEETETIVLVPSTEETEASADTTEVTYSETEASADTTETTYSETEVSTNATKTTYSVSTVSSNDFLISFVEESGLVKSAMPGDVISFNVTPYDNARTVDTVLVLDEKGNEIPTSKGIHPYFSFVMPEASVTISATLGTVETLQEQPTKTTTVQEGMNETNQDYILSMVNPSLANATKLEKVDVLTVKQTMIDGNLAPEGVTLNDILGGDEFGTYFNAFLGMQTGAVPLYNVDDMSDYYVAYANTMLHDADMSVSEYAFAYTNLNAELIENAIYDVATGLAYVPKSAASVDKNGLGTNNVQLQLVQRCVTASPTSSIAVNIEAEGDVLSSGYVETDAMDSSVQIQLAEDEEAKQHLQNSDIHITIENSEVNPDAYAYDVDTGVLSIGVAPATVSELNISVEEPTIIENIIGSLIETVSAYVTNADTMTSVSGVSVSGSAGSYVDIPVTLQYCADGNATQFASSVTYVIPGGEYETYTNAALPQTVSLGTSAMYFRATTKDAASGVVNIPANYSFVLQCAHIAQPFSSNSSANWGTAIDGVIRVTVLDNNDNYATFSVVSQTLNTQTGVGVFKTTGEGEGTDYAAIYVYKEADSASEENSTKEVAYQVYDEDGELVTKTARVVTNPDLDLTTEFVAINVDGNVNGNTLLRY